MNIFFKIFSIGFFRNLSYIISPALISKKDSIKEEYCETCAFLNKYLFRMRAQIDTSLGLISSKLD
jgi:hypothetical protein